ncbi:MAG: hypothetical protein JETT_0699 [Candidatus Jettenia ecosi]|uniref:Uncharacterized protein n=1 Tax=Candidatus Jettenia ecosi TaxID=2494326 RepID=A0A533QE34_9BACT|nr:MAG: hypothetical protein JETT_0699 [Candidatus Jettenia ecosi]
MPGNDSFEILATKRLDHLRQAVFGVTGYTLAGLFVHVEYHPQVFAPYASS